MALRILGRLKTTVAIGPSCCTRMSALGLTVVQCSRGTQVPALAQAARGWWRWEELNLRHGAYETPALPLSYTAKCREIRGLRTGILSHRGRVCPKICPRRSPHAGRPPGVALFRDVAAVESAARPVAGDGHRRVLRAFRPEPCCRCPSGGGRRRDVRERRRQSEARMRPSWSAEGPAGGPQSASRSRGENRHHAPVVLLREAGGPRHRGV